MTLPEEYRPCRYCGALCDGDVCSDSCAIRLEHVEDDRDGEEPDPNEEDELESVE